jgi:DNA replication and repair protein RecF
MAPAILEGLKLTNVRSHSGLELAFGPGLNILVGGNGVGKTSVLEAIALLLRGDMLRPGAPKDLIRQGEDHVRVEGRLRVGGASLTAAVAHSRSGERRITADGAALADADRWRDTLPVRSFVPDDLRLVKGGPRRRREYLDGLAALCDKTYIAGLKQYEEALSQRNSLLRGRWSDRDAAQFAPWERILARTGLEISASRAATLARFTGPFLRTHARLTGDSPETMRLVYRTNVGEFDEEEYEERLAENRGADQQRTYTHLGPHRDDLRLVRNGLDVRECASQGEQRAAVLSLVLAEWSFPEDRPQRALLLLDDVMSELDETRRRALVALLREGGQTIVTTTDLRYFTDDEVDAAAVIEVVRT